MKKQEEETNKEVKAEDMNENKPVLRQIIIETDGAIVKLTKNETAGKIELIGILQSLTQFLMNNK